MQDSRAVWLAAVGILLVFFGFFFHYYALPEIIRRMIIENVVLKDGSEALQRWSHTPQPLHYDVYFFHVENPEEVMKGARPVLKEKGPYVYDLYRERADLRFHDDDTISYFDKSTYQFNQAKSGCRSDNDVVTVLHAPIVGTSLKLQKKMPDALGVFNDAMELLFENPSVFATAKVREILFDGIFINCSFSEDSFPAGPVCNGLRERAPHTYRRSGTNFYFSMFNHLNGTSHTRVRISRGQKDPLVLGRIRQIGNSSTISKWRAGSPCNMVNGTDSTIFRPFLEGVDRLPVYQSGSCRSLHLVYKHKTEVNGVPALHFITDPRMFSSGRDYLPNRCFCSLPPEPEPDAEEEPAAEEAAPAKEAQTESPPSADTKRRRRAVATSDEKDSEECLPEGALDMSTCFGSPVVMTYPHFFLGSSSLQEYPVGLKPDKDKHQTILDLEPVSGIPMRGAKRVQLNMYLKKIEDITVLGSVSEGLFPILWLEEGITLEGASMQLMISAHRGLQMLNAAPWALLVLGCVLMVVGALFYAYSSGMIIRTCLMLGVIPMPKPGPHRVDDGPGEYRYALGFGPSSNGYNAKAKMAGGGTSSVFEHNMPGSMPRHLPAAMTGGMAHRTQFQNMHRGPRNKVF